MAAGPPRLPTPAAHVTAHVAPVERALLERARVLEEDPGSLGGSILEAAAATEGASAAWLRTYVANVVAAEFRALAAELHHWP